MADASGGRIRRHTIQPHDFSSVSHRPLLYHASISKLRTPAPVISAATIITSVQLGAPPCTPGCPPMPHPVQRPRRHRAGLSRISTACERCRVKKNKCDGASPVCSECRRAGTECIVVDRLTHRPLPRGHVDALERENQELRRRIEVFEHIALENTSISEPHGVSTPLSTPAPPVSAGGTPSDGSLERTALDPGSDNSGMYVGESGGSFFGSLVQKTLMQSGYQHETGPLHSSLRVNLNNQIQPGRATLTDTSGRLDEALLDPELIFRLEEAFFDHRWPSLPFLHRPTFREQHLQPFSERREDATSTSHFLVLMVLAMGAIDLGRQDRSVRKLPSLYFTLAMTHHFDGIIQSDGPEAVQALLLVGCFALNSSCGVNAWHVAGQAVRVAISLGLHRQSGASAERLPQLQVEMRKRIFWCAYSVDRNVSLALGRPPAIRDADIDIELPQCLTDEDLMKSAETGDTFTTVPRPCDTSAFIHIVELRRLRSRIQDTLYPAKPCLSDAEIQSRRAAMHSDLEAWAASTPRYDQAKVLTFQTNEWFQITYSQSLLLLYRPSPACPLASQEALQICSENAINLIMSYSSLYAKNKMAYTWITLHSLLMASITMLYTLWVSPTIREQTAPAVVDSNIKLCLMLFEVMQETWPLAARCHDIVQRFGTAALGLWQNNSSQGHLSRPNTNDAASTDQEIGADYAAWFGVHSSNNHAESRPTGEPPSANPDSNTGLGVLSDMDDSIFQDFDINLPLMMDVFSDSTSWN